jgi:hypothetical protein
MAVARQRAASDSPHGVGRRRGGRRVGTVEPHAQRVGRRREPVVDALALRRDSPALALDGTARHLRAERRIGAAERIGLSRPSNDGRLEPLLLAAGRGAARRPDGLPRCCPRQICAAAWAAARSTMPGFHARAYELRIMSGACVAMRSAAAASERPSSSSAASVRSGEGYPI